MASEWLGQWLNEAGYCCFQHLLPYAHQAFEWYKEDLNYSQMQERLQTLTPRLISKHEVEMFIRDMEASHLFGEQQKPKNFNFTPYDDWIVAKLKQNLSLEDIHTQLLKKLPQPHNRNCNFSFLRQYLNFCYGSVRTGTSNLFENRQFLTQQVQQGMNPNELYQHWVKERHFVYPAFTFYVKLNKLRPFIDFPWEIEVQRQHRPSKNNAFNSAGQYYVRYIFPHHDLIKQHITQGYRARNLAKMLKQLHPNTEIERLSNKLTMLYPILRNNSHRTIAKVFKAHEKEIVADLAQGTEKKAIFARLKSKIPVPCHYRQFSNWVFLLQNDLLDKDLLNGDLDHKIAQYLSQQNF